jgi:hypothetical protein
MKMILFYSVMMFLLGMVKLLVSVRARALERKFTRVSAAVSQLLHESETKPGNSNKADPCVSAKRTLMLGQLVEKRDRVEAKYFAWQRWADRFTHWIHTVREWKGKKLPYTLGAVDVWMLLSLVDYFGVGQYVSAGAMIEAVAALWAQ